MQKKYKNVVIVKTNKKSVKINGEKKSADALCMIYNWFMILIIV